MKRLALFCMFFLPLFAWAQKQYFLPTATRGLSAPAAKWMCRCALSWRCHEMAVVGERRGEDGIVPK